MLHVELHQAKRRTALALPVHHPRCPGQVLLRRGCSLEPRTIPRLQELKVRTIWMDHPALKSICQFVDSKLHTSQAPVVSKVADTFTDLWQSSAAKFQYDAYCSTIGGMIDEFIAHPRSAIFLETSLTRRVRTWSEIPSQSST